MTVAVEDIAEPPPQKRPDERIAAACPPVSNFRSDNTSGVCPQIMAALALEGAHGAPAYGADPLTHRLDAVFGEVFETSVRVFAVITGTAANALALSSISPPHSTVLCHDQSHILRDEAGAAEFYGDIRLQGLPSDGGKLSPDGIERALDTRRSAGSLRVATLSIAQATEWGCVYTPDEIAALSDLARANGMAVHLDGARLANALASLGCSPADATWKAGVDVLSLGATKNGALAAEAVVFFGDRWAAGFADRSRRGGHTLSKMRFISAQLIAYLSDGLWLRNAAWANERARDLGEALSRLPGIKLAAPLATNQVFVQMPDTVIAGLVGERVECHRWGGRSTNTFRLVTAFDTPVAEVKRFVEMISRHTNTGKHP